MGDVRIEEPDEAALFELELVELVGDVENEEEVDDDDDDDDDDDEEFCWGT